MADKFYLKVKSGPGELVGVSELESTDNVINFNGVQFTEPGDYIITAFSSSGDIEEKDFNIKILPQEDIISQDSDVYSDEVKTLNGELPIISQIDQPSIKLDPIEFDATISDTENENIGSGIGVTPFVWYNGHQIRPDDIKKLEIYHSDFLPSCTLVIRDTLGYVNSPETSPLNNSKFEVFLNSGSKILKSIHLKCKLELNQKNKNGTNTITGIIDLEHFYKQTYKSYKGTSFEVLKRISSENKLGFNSNILNTNDSMVWIKNGQNYFEFIDKIITHSYKSDDSFILGYIDNYWSFNLVDIEKEWKRDISNDVGILSTGFSSVKKSEEIVRLLLTNDESMSTSPLYFSNYKFINNSTYKNTKRGTYTISKTYDVSNKSFLKFNINPLRSDTSDKLVLSNMPNEKEDIDNYLNSFQGKLNDNVHKNYKYAIDHNLRNLDNLSNVSMELTLPNVNYNLYKYQKINLTFINKSQTMTNQKVKDERLSGEWLIIDIRYTWKKNAISQSLTIVRKELGKTLNEINSQIEVYSAEKGNSEINENPETEKDNTINAPNLKYDEGDIYVSENEYGELYNVEILKILENGKEVAAIIDLIVNNSFTNSNTSVRNSYVLSNNENTKVNAILNVEKENNFFNSDYGYLIIKYKKD